MTDTPYLLPLTASELVELMDLVEAEAFELQVGPYEREAVRAHAARLNAILDKLRALRAP